MSRFKERISHQLVQLKAQVYKEVGIEEVQNVVIKDKWNEVEKLENSEDLKKYLFKQGYKVSKEDLEKLWFYVDQEKKRLQEGSSKMQPISTDIAATVAKEVDISNLGILEIEKALKNAGVLVEENSFDWKEESKAAFWVGKMLGKGYEIYNIDPMSDTYILVALEKGTKLKYDPQYVVKMDENSFEISASNKKRAGTWSLPYTEEKAKKLAEIIQSLPDGDLSALQKDSLEDELYFVFGDDMLFDDIDSGKNVKQKLVLHISKLIQYYKSNPESFRGKFTGNALGILEQIVSTNKVAVSDVKNADEEKPVILGPSGNPVESPKEEIPKTDFKPYKIKPKDFDPEAPVLPTEEMNTLWSKITEAQSALEKIALLVKDVNLKLKNEIKRVEEEGSKLPYEHQLQGAIDALALMIEKAGIKTLDLGDQFVALRKETKDNPFKPTLNWKFEKLLEHYKDAETYLEKAVAGAQSMAGEPTKIRELVKWPKRTSAEDQEGFFDIVKNIYDNLKGFLGNVIGLTKEIKEVKENIKVAPEEASNAS